MLRKNNSKALQNITYSVHNHETVYCECFGDKHSHTFSSPPQSQCPPHSQYPYDFPYYSQTDHDSRSIYSQARSIPSSNNPKIHEKKSKITLSNKIPIRKTLQNKLHQYFDTNSSIISKERHTCNIYGTYGHKKTNSVSIKQGSEYLRSKKNQKGSIMENSLEYSKYGNSLSRPYILDNSLSKPCLADDSDQEKTVKQLSEGQEGQYNWTQETWVRNPQRKNKKVTVELGNNHESNYELDPASENISRNDRKKNSLRRDSLKMHRQTHTQDLSKLNVRKFPNKLDDMVKKKHLSYRTSDYSLDSGHQVTRIALPIDADFKLIDEELEDNQQY